MNITWIGSPNFSPGRDGKPVDRIIIHWIDGTLATADLVFRRDGSKPPYPGASANFAVEDENIHQYVKLADTAWHAGNFDVNQRSAGIEHSAQPGRDASDATYETSSQLIVQICRQLGLVPSRALLRRHSEVIPTQCPGTIDLDRLAARAVEIWNEQGADQPVTSGSPAVLASAPVSQPVSVPVHFDITITPDKGANVRYEADTSPTRIVDGKEVTNIYIAEPKGAVIHCTDTVKGGSATFNGVTSSSWYETEGGHYISATVATHN